MASFYCIILCDRKNPSLHVCTLCIGIFTFKMATHIICLQDELPIVLITTLDLKTFIKGHHVYKDIWRGQKNDSRKRMFEITEVRVKSDFCKEVLGNVQETVDNSSG